MIQQILIVAQQVLMLFLMMGIGFTLGRMGKITGDGVRQLTFIVAHISMPCVVFSSLMIDGSAEYLSMIGLIFVVIVAITAIQAGVSMLMFRRQPKSLRTVLQCGTFYSNAGFVGVALMQSTLGDEAVLFATLIMIVDTVLMYIHMPAIMSDHEGTFPLGKIFLNPGTISFALGMLRLSFGIPIPNMLASVISTMRGMNMPLAMIIVGVQISRVDVLEAFSRIYFHLAALVKLLLWPILLLIILHPLPIPALAYCAIVICKATSQPATLGAFVENFGQDGNAASQLVALTTVLSIVTLPIVVAVCQMTAS